MKAKLTNYHQAPRKVRLVADLIRGKKVDEALTVLRFLPKRAAGPFVKLLTSAVANSQADLRIQRDKLRVAKVNVDKGIVFRRFRAGARGRAYPVKKRSSQIVITLGQ